MAILVPGQWQLGDGGLIIGTGTNIKIESTDAKAYDINAQDYQVARSDELRFGFDYLKPTTIELTMQVLHNYLLPPFENTIANFWHDMPTVNDLAAAWRGDDIRLIWGQVMPFYTCSKLDEITKIVYGRFGQFTYTPDDYWDKGIAVKCIGEIRRADTFAYSGTEHTATLGTSVLRTGGDGPTTWMRAQINAPFNNPTLTVGDYSFTINHSLSSGHAIVSSYPWERYCVDSNGVNLAGVVVGANKYLDNLKIPYNSSTPIHVDSGSGTVAWRDSYAAI